MRVRDLSLLAFATVALALAPGARGGPPPDDSGPLPTIRGTSTQSRIEPTFSTEASRLAGETLEVRCWSTIDWARLSSEHLAWSGNDLTRANGFARLPAPRIDLSPDTCARLDLLAYTHAWPSSLTSQEDMANALSTLAHLSEFLGKRADIARALCWGMQMMRTEASALGVSESHASILAAVFWRRVYPTYPPTWISSGCRDGGLLDLRPRSHIWP